MQLPGHMEIESCLSKGQAGIQDFFLADKSENNYLILFFLIMRCQFSVLLQGSITLTSLLATFCRSTRPTLSI